MSDDADATVAVNRYDDWGVPGRRNLGRFQYTGQMWLPELRFYYYKARMYSPTLGRFLQPVATKMSEDEKEAENERGEAICRIVKTRECWASAAVRRGRRAADQPVPPPYLQTGTKPGWLSRHIVTGVGVIGVVGSAICILAEPCGAAVAVGLGSGGATALLLQ